MYLVTTQSNCSFWQEYQFCSTDFHLPLTVLDVRLALLKAGIHSYAPSATTLSVIWLCVRRPSIDCVILSRLPEPHKQRTPMRSLALDSVRASGADTKPPPWGPPRLGFPPPAVHGKGRGIVAALCPRAIQTQMRWVFSPNGSEKLSGQSVYSKARERRILSSNQALIFNLSSPDSFIDNCCHVPETKAVCRVRFASLKISWNEKCGKKRGCQWT